MVFPTKAGARHCPVEGCGGQAETRTSVRLHFWNWHVWYTMVILEEGNLPHLRFPLCNMMVPWRSLNEYHKSTVNYKKRAERKQQQLAA